MRIRKESFKINHVNIAFFGEIFGLPKDDDINTNLLLPKIVM